ncbi:MAG: glycoside hydrolase family 2 TIM barrel-domain containing protein [Saccharofermentanales bacterium]
MKSKIYRPQWVTGATDDPDSKPDVYITAEVPGAVQLDWGRAKGLPDHNFGSNVKLYESLHNKFWHYKTEFFVESVDGHTPELVFDSIEYQYDIYINSIRLISGQGIYTPVRIPLEEYSDTRIEVEVLIYPAPSKPGSKTRHEEYTLSCKPPFAYGWDWCPRLIALGLCGDVRVEYLPIVRIDSFVCLYRLSDDLNSAQITAEYSLKGYIGSLRLSVYAPEGESVSIYDFEPDSSNGKFVFDIMSPRLWWPAGHGEQPMYKITLCETSGMYTGCSVSCDLGFRRVRLVSNEGTWDEQKVFPMTQNKEPITIEINGRKIFAKGSNLVPFDLFPSLVTYDNYHRVLELVRDANMNILRVWGGGYVHGGSFYDICDQFGIMVWQEFPLACASYPDDRAYLSVLDQEARSIIRKLRGHPSLTVWSGGNELFNSWSKMTSQSLPLRLLNSICYEMDPLTPFIQTSPLYGMGHGHYLLMADSETEALTNIRSSCKTAYTEFGVAAPSPWDYLTTFIPENELYDPKPGGAWEQHHAFNAWGDEDHWISFDHINRFHGNPASLQEKISNGNTLQALTYRYLFEEMRKQWPYTSMALNWCLNEPWPTAAGNSLLNYPAEPKPCYYSVREALKDRKASLRFTKILWSAGEMFTSEIWLLNTSPDAITSGTLRIYAFVDGKNCLNTTWDHGTVCGLTNLQGPEISFILPESSSYGTSCFEIVIESDQDPSLSSSFTLLLEDKGRRTETLNGERDIDK